MDEIFIKELSARGIIGINDWEREKPQEILVNIVLFTDIRRAGKEDDLSYSVNYRTVAKKVMQHTETAAPLTVEALATDIARLCLAEVGVQKVRVRVEKPGAVRFARSVGIEIERTKQDFE
jgi:FolB domain-containing protein